MAAGVVVMIIGTPHTHNAGYLLRNQDLSLAKRQEADIQCCKHCQAVIKMQEWREDGAWCSKCQSPVCARGECAVKTEKFGCLPYIAYIERLIEDEVTLNQYRKMVGIDTPPAGYQPQIMVGVRHG